MCLFKCPTCDRTYFRSLLWCKCSTLTFHKNCIPCQKANNNAEKALGKPENSQTLSAKLECSNPSCKNIFAKLSKGSYCKYEDDDCIFLEEDDGRPTG